MDIVSILNEQQLKSSDGNIQIRRSMDEKDDIVVQFIGDKLIIGEDTVDENHPLGKYKLDKEKD